MMTNKSDSTNEAILFTIDKTDKVQLRCYASEWKNNTFIHIREFIKKDDGNYIPTKTGVTVPITLWPFFVKEIANSSKAAGKNEKLRTVNSRELENGTTFYFEMVGGPKSRVLPEADLRRIALEQWSENKNMPKSLDEFEPATGTFIYRARKNKEGKLNCKKYATCSRKNGQLIWKLVDKT